MRFIGIFIIIGMVCGAIASIDYTKFIDLPSLLIVLGGAIGYVLAKGKPNTFFKDFENNWDVVMLTVCYNTLEDIQSKDFIKTELS